MVKRILFMLAVLMALGSSGVYLHSQARPAGWQATPAATISATVSATETAQPFTLVNLNTASEDQLLKIPNMNNRMVREFLEYRPYISIAQFRKEIGKYISAEQVAAYEKYVYVPVQVDASDVVTLKQIPGVDDKIAADLIAARPYKTNDAFLTKLATYLSSAQVAFAWNYLEGKESTTPPAVATAAATMAATSAATPVAQAFTLVNLNTASEDQLLKIPNMNSRMVREFFEYRPYISIAQFRKEIGKYISAEQVAAYEKYVYVPVQIDASDVVTLKQIPGVDDKIAADLIAARPYKTNDAFLTKLATYLSPDQTTFAGNYLEDK